MTLRVHLGGEGATELGHDPAWDDVRSAREPGLLEVVLERRHSDRFEVTGATKWKNLKKLAAPRRGRHRDVQNVLKLCQRAVDVGADVVAFTRDQDGDDGRAGAIAEGIEAARRAFPELHVIGASATPCIEAWVLATAGEPHRRSVSAVKRRMTELHLESLAAMTRVLRDDVDGRWDDERTTGLGDFVRAAASTFANPR